MPPVLTDFQLDYVVRQVADRLTGKPGGLILPPGDDPGAPPVPAPTPAPGTGGTKWWQDKNFWANVVTILTLVAGILAGGQKLADTERKADAAATQSAANATKIDEGHAETAAQLTAVHQGVEDARREAHKAASAPRTFLPAPPTDGKEDQ